MEGNLKGIQDDDGEVVWRRCMQRQILYIYMLRCRDKLIDKEEDRLIDQKRERYVPKEDFEKY